MKSTNNCVYSISSDEDDVPLKVNGYHNHHAHHNGQTDTLHDIHVCEFCDKYFYKRYDLLVHNTKHMIIPLEKQIVHQCNECLFYYQSLNQLYLHVMIRHPDLIKYKRKIEKMINWKHEGTNQPKTVKDENVIVHTGKFIIGKEKVIVKQEKNIVEQEKVIVKEEKDVSIKSRLQFEDDEDISPMLHDLTTDCKVNIEEIFTCPLIKSKVENSLLQQKESQVYSESVHNDDLLEDGPCACRCGKTFQNRYELIIHEASHIIIKKPHLVVPLCTICERLICGNYRNLRRHQEAKHKDITPKPNTKQHCRKCSLLYSNYKKHCQNYHYDDDTSNDESLKQENNVIDAKIISDDQKSNLSNVNDSDKFKKWYFSTIKVCELCYSFLKNKSNIQYVYIGDLSEVGVRQPCERCEKAFFEVRIVKVRHLRRVGAQAPQEDKEKKRKVLSNDDRLHNIKKRLKMLNTLSRF